MVVVLPLLIVLLQLVRSLAFTSFTAGCSSIRAWVVQMLWTHLYTLKGAYLTRIKEDVNQLNEAAAAQASTSPRPASAALLDFEKPEPNRNVEFL
jgi:hypothetical protein